MKLFTTNKNKAIIYLDSNNRLHRIDGPAIEFVNRDKEWYIEGKHINVNSQEEFERYLKFLIFT